MEIGNEQPPRGAVHDAQAACFARFLDALTSVQATPYRLRRCSRPARLRLLEGFRRLRVVRRET